MLLIEGMKGLGDNVYQRAFIKQIKEPLYLQTPWPELYQDLPHVYPVKSHTELRTQNKNEKASQANWHTPTSVTKTIQSYYGHNNIFRGMREALKVMPSTMDLPDFGQHKFKGNYYVVRPVTIRSEWPNQSRNPLPEYISEAAYQIRNRGGIVISIADLQDRQEWALEPLPQADVTLHAGELSVTELMSLCAGATALVGGIGWIVPVAMALNKPALVVCGGQGAYNSPEMLTTESIKHNIRFAVPDNMCMCYEKDHNCDKRISDYGTIFKRWLDLGY
jgi:hypothetical protein